MSPGRMLSNALCRSRTETPLVLPRFRCAFADLRRQLRKQLPRQSGCIFPFHFDLDRPQDPSRPQEDP